MNDWEFKKFLAFVTVTQLVVALVLITRDVVSYDVPILIQIVGFIYLSFIPGIIILRILRLHWLGSTTTLLYAVGLSLSFCMFIGLLLNSFGPLIGISNPISTYPLLITMTSSVLILCGLSYWRDRNAYNIEFSDIKVHIREFVSPPILFLFLIILTSILGAFLVRFYHNNVLLLLLIVMICIAVTLIGFKKFIPAKLYPIGIFAISIALLYSYTLVSPYLSGWDIHLEYYFAQLTMTHSHWDSTIANSYNAMLSITILPTIYSHFMNADIAWIFKVAYPLFFSLVPLALYEVYRRQTNLHTAFMSVFFFMSLPLFFIGMASLARQQIAELFLALLILLMISREMTGFQKAILAIIFSASLIVSHYSISYIYIFYILLTLPLLYLLKKVAKDVKTATMLTGTFICLYVVMALSWYIYTADSKSFSNIVLVGQTTYNNITDFFHAGTREVSTLKLLGLGQSESFLHSVSVYFYRITLFFIIVGVLRLLVKRKMMKLEPEYYVMTLLSSILLIICVALPYFAGFLNMDRIYHVTLFFLSPLCILGGQSLFRWLFTLPKAAWIKMRSMIGRWKLTIPTRGYSVSHTYTNLVVLLVLIPYFLFSSGFIYEVAQDKGPTSISLSQAGFERSNIDKVVVSFHSEYVFTSDVVSARWLSNFRTEEGTIYSDDPSKWYILPNYALIFPSEVIYPETEVEGGSYIYLSNLNVVKSLMHVPVKNEPPSSKQAYNYATSYISPLLTAKIYSNGESEVYLKQ